VPKILTRAARTDRRNSHFFQSLANSTGVVERLNYVPAKGGGERETEQEENEEKARVWNSQKQQQQQPIPNKQLTGN
jgi:hypothetical protein